MGLIILLDGQSIEEVDEQLQEVKTKLLEKARLSMDRARQARKTGDFKKWGKYCSIARAYKISAHEITMIGCPY